MKNIFCGMGVAMVTPFRSDGTIDYTGLERLTNHLIDGGVDNLVIMGTTGESVTLTDEERNSVLEFVIEINKNRKPLILGVGGNNTSDIVNKIQHKKVGVDGVLSVSPSYNKPTQEGIYQHFEAISKASTLPIMLYNVPGRTGSNMTADTTLRLAKDFDNILAIKEASGDLLQVQNIISDKPNDFAVISGDDALALAMISIGGEGLVSVIGNAFPAEYSQMINSALTGDFPSARHLHYEFYKMIDLLFRDGNPAGVKECLQNLGICENHLRLPLLPVTMNTKHQLYRMMAELKTVGV